MVNDGNGDVILARQVNNFGHPHSLTIGEYDPESLRDEVCDRCVLMPISAPFYTCADTIGRCNFFIHGECFELPVQIQHQLHLDHPLVLNSFLDLPGNDNEVGFICYGCSAFSNGFVYTCLACKFFLDVRCSLLSDTLVHETHPRRLTLVDKKSIQPSKGEIKCNGCNLACCSCRYTCKECSFELDLGCVSLPKMLMHSCPERNWDMRPQHLRYHHVATEDGDDGLRDDINSCDWCEDPIGENEWHYYCKDCRCLEHSRCTDTARRGLMKTGIVYRAYNHFHNLVTATSDDGRYKDCAVCQAEIGESLGVYCAKCDAYIHVKCCRELRRA